MPQGKPANQHLVSQFMLKQFANDDGEVLQVAPPSVKSREPEMLLVKRAAMERDFYTARVAAGDPYGFERYLSGLESKAAPVVRSILNADLTPSPKRKAWLAEFVGLQVVRGTRAPQHLSAGIHEALDLFDDIVSADIASLGGAPLFSHGAAIRRLAKEVTRDSIKEALLLCVEGNRPEVLKQRGLALAKSIEQAHWGLASFEEPCLILGDEAVAVPRPCHDEPEKAATIWMPLSRTEALEFCFCDAPRLGVIERRVAPPLLATAINWSIAARSEKFLVSHPQDVDSLNTAIDSVYEHPFTRDRALHVLDLDLRTMHD